MQQVGKRKRLSSHPPTVVGVDVGGEKKGYHAVALREEKVVGKLTTCSAAGVVTWCRDHRASAVAIDAPCKWSLTGKARACERQLAGLGVSAFSTPSLAIGQVNSFYRWMVNGAELFRLLAPEYPLMADGTGVPGRLRFETYPHAIACALAGQILSAKHKRLDRRRLLHLAGISTDALKTIDEIDAALCALAAQHVLAGTFKAYGDEAEGFIVVPSM
jgi:predicted nuclease with RNAse H fold